MRRAGRRRAPAAGITPRKRACSSSPKRHRSSRDAADSLAADARLPVAAVAESVFAVADRNVLGNPCRDPDLRAVLGLRVAATAGVSPVYPLGEHLVDAGKVRAHEQSAKG